MAPPRILIVAPDDKLLPAPTTVIEIDPVAAKLLAHTLDTWNSQSDVIKRSSVECGDPATDATQSLVTDEPNPLLLLLALVAVDVTHNVDSALVRPTRTQTLLLEITPVPTTVTETPPVDATFLTLTFDRLKVESIEIVLVNVERE